MKKKKLGRTGLMVTEVGMGGIPIQRVSDDEAVSVVRRCLELGINYLDTAPNYETSEARIGKAIAGRSEGLVLASKTYARTAAGLEEQLNRSLKLLGADAIDLYQFHNVSDAGAFEALFTPGGALSAAEKAKKEGRIRHIGVSSHSLDLAKELVRTERFETIMFPFNFVACEAESELLPLVRQHEMGFIAMKPLAGGLLNEVSIAFKYLKQFPDVVPIVGIERVREIEEVVAVIEGPPEMTATELAEMKRLKQGFSSRFCRRCDYCQPCGEGIPISTVLILLSLAKRQVPERIFSGEMANAMGKAALCDKCGDCEPRCPYGLPIIDMITEHVAWYQAEKEKYDIAGMAKG